MPRIISLIAIAVLALIIVLEANIAFAQESTSDNSEASVHEKVQSPPYPQFAPGHPVEDFEPAACRASGRLIACGDGAQNYDPAQYALISRGWTLSYADYKSVEIWIWWWDGTRWTLMDWRKGETNTGTYIEIVSRLGNEWIPGGWYTMTSRHHARNSLFDQETIDITSYPFVWVP